MSSSQDVISHKEDYEQPFPEPSPAAEGLTKRLKQKNR